MDDLGSTSGSTSGNRLGVLHIPYRQGTLATPAKLAGLVRIDWRCKMAWLALLGFNRRLVQRGTKGGLAGDG